MIRLIDFERHICLVCSLLQKVESPISGKNDSYSCELGGGGAENAVESGKNRVIQRWKTVLRWS